jgi:hypothetical protein
LVDSTSAWAGGEPHSSSTETRNVPLSSPIESRHASATAVVKVFVTVGCIVVELLTGAMPVRAKRREDCQSLHLAGSALKAVGEVRAEMRKWLTGCLAVRVVDRYRTWDELERELGTAYEHVAVRPALTEAPISEPT